MPSIRIGFSSEFVLRNELVGIGSTATSSRLDVAGQIRSENTAGSGGVSTFREYQGFSQTQAEISNEILIDNGYCGPFSSLTGEIKITGETTVSSGSTVEVGKTKTLTVTDKFAVPLGDTNSRDNTPEAGTTRFNQDFGTLEFFDGNNWKTVNSYARGGAAGRGVFAGRHSPTFLSTIDYIQIPTLGNAVSFGDLTDEVQARSGGYSDGNRGVFCGGSKPSLTDDCDYITIPSAGNGIDFGNLTSARDFVSSCSSSTRGITAGGRSGSPTTAQNIIEYAELQTIGNHIDFGDLSVATHVAAAGSSPTRAVFAGGGNASDVTISTIQTVNFAAKGNAVKFGDLTVINRPGSGGCSNSVRALFAGGYVPGGIRFNSIDVLNLASGGNAVDSGNLDRLLYSPMGLASQTRAVFGGGQDTSGKINNIQYVNISTLGNAADFGDLTEPGRAGGTASDSHGGLGGF